jgi:hypothetical protein
MTRVAQVAFAREVRKYDLHRMISSGNTMPRPSAWHQKAEKTWTRDTPAQQAEILLGDNSDPIDTLSIHAYEESAPQDIRFAMAVSATCKKPLFVGEFGVQGGGEQVAKEFRTLLEAIEREQVPLAAVWVFDFAQQTDRTVTESNVRAYQLEALERANRSIRE